MQSFTLSEINSGLENIHSLFVITNSLYRIGAPSHVRLTRSCWIVIKRTDWCECHCLPRNACFVHYNYAKLFFFIFSSSLRMMERGEMYHHHHHHRHQYMATHRYFLAIYYGILIIEFMVLWAESRLKTPHTQTCGGSNCNFILGGH